MSTPFGKDQQVTDSRDVAVLCVYLGYPLVRVETGLDRSETFTVVCPEFDWQQVVQEAASDATQVCYASLQKANALVGAKVGYARRNGGTWSHLMKSMVQKEKS